MSEPTQSFPAPDLEEQEPQDGSEQGAQSTEDVPREHAEEPAEGPDDGPVAT
jgi:hypothetical protein